MSGLRGYLLRYWFRWRHPSDAAAHAIYSRVGAGLGCGVTAVDVEDAKNLISTVVLRGDPVPLIADVVEDVDVQTLDEGHVVPNMGDPSVRGVWFPQY